MNFNYRVQRAYIKRAELMAMLTVKYSSPDKYSGGDVIILNIYEMYDILDKIAIVNNEIINIVSEYNMQLSSVNNRVRFLHQGGCCYPGTNIVMK